MFLVRAVAFVLALVLVAAAGVGVWAWDRNPGFDYLVPAPLRWAMVGPLRPWREIVIPPGPIHAHDAELAACRAPKVISKATQDVAKARAGVQSYSKVAALKAYQPKGSDECARLEDADRAVLEALK